MTPPSWTKYLPITACPLRRERGLFSTRRQAIHYGYSLKIGRGKFSALTREEPSHRKFFCGLRR